jgi:hypothetical protein
VILGLDFYAELGRVLTYLPRRLILILPPASVGPWTNIQAPGQTFRPLSPECLNSGSQQYSVNLSSPAADIAHISQVHSRNLDLEDLMAKFPALFSMSLDTAKCAPYEIELSDVTPVRSHPYHCAPLKLAIFKRMVNDLLEQGVITTSKSQYASPSFLVPKNGG